jgi:hypothetical protein
MRASSARLNAVAILASVAVFVAVEAMAMRAYPGGTWWDAQAVGHRFWQNFLCDIEWRVALNGARNPVGSRLAFFAMATLVAGLAPFWVSVAEIISRDGKRPLAAAVRLSGGTSMAGILAVISLPSDTFGALHGVFVIAASLLGFVAATLAVLGLRMAGRSGCAALGASAMVVAVFDFVLYVSHFATHTQDSPLTPALQKVALGLLLAWMVAVARSEAS